VRYKTFISLCSKFIQESAYQILLELPSFIEDITKKNILVSFSGHTVYTFVYEHYISYTEIHLHKMTSA